MQRKWGLNFATNTRKGCSSSDICEEARGRFIEWLWRQIKRKERGGCQEEGCYSSLGGKEDL